MRWLWATASADPGTCLPICGTTITRRLAASRVGKSVAGTVRHAGMRACRLKASSACMICPTFCAVRRRSVSSFLVLSSASCFSLLRRHTLVVVVVGDGGELLRSGSVEACWRQHMLADTETASL